MKNPLCNSGAWGIFITFSLAVFERRQNPLPSEIFFDSDSSNHHRHYLHHRRLILDSMRLHAQVRWLFLSYISSTVHKVPAALQLHHLQKCKCPFKFLCRCRYGT